MKGLLAILAASSLVGACASAMSSGATGDDGDDDGSDGSGSGSGDGSGDGSGSGSGSSAPDPRRGWVDLGTPTSGTATDAQSPSLALWNGRPVVAFSQDQHVQVQSLENDTTWTAVGQPLRNSTGTNVVTYDPTPAVGADGLSVVWPEWSSGAMANPVRRMENSAWVPPTNVPALGTTGALSFLPHSTAAIDGDGSLWVAYSETTDLNAPMRISVVSVLGNIVGTKGAGITATNTNTHAIAPTIAIGNGEKYLAWSENGVRIAKRNSSTGLWDAFGGSPITVAGRAASTQANQQLSVDPAGRPIIAFTSSDGTENGIYVGRWNGTSWTYWGQMVQATPGTVMGNTTHPYLYDVKAAGNDVAFIAWSEADATGVEGIYVDRCTPAGCALVGRGRLDATVGATPGSAPKLAIDGQGRPLVTWTEKDAMGITQIHVWRYHGDPDL